MIAGGGHPNPLLHAPAPSIRPILDGSTSKANGQRSCSASETLRRIAAFFAGYGITRIANVTGLDRIGIPVCMAVRPNSRGLAVSQGKGLDLDAAKVSAAVESIEGWHAERPLCTQTLERYSDLSARAAAADPHGLAISRNSAFAPNRTIPWAEATDLQTGVSVWVPFELVHADATLPRMPGSGCFVFSTNGLASGNGLAEATLHALCELIERDAIALWKVSGGEACTETRIDPDSVEDGACRELLHRYRAAGIMPMLWDVSSDIGLPVFRVLIYDEWAGASLTPYATAFGAGCHPSREVALSRALTEAAQSRLTAIAGSRDDGTRGHFEATQGSAAAEYYGALAKRPASLRFDQSPSANHRTLEADLRHAIHCLAARGMTQVLNVDLTRPDSPVAVVRCIVPGLEGPSSSPSYAPGRRARAVTG